MQASDINETGKIPFLFRIIRRIIRIATPKYKLYGTENLPEEPCVIVGNHCQLYGPIGAELQLPRPHDIWCIGAMEKREEIPTYS